MPYLELWSLFFCVVDLRLKNSCYIVIDCCVINYSYVSGGMSELQATLEFSVELNKFYNVDLFQRG